MNQTQSETASLSASRCSTKLITEQDANPKLRQELTCHRVGRWRPGQDPPSETSVLPGNRRPDLRCDSVDRDRIEGSNRKTVEMPQLQFVDEVVDISIVIQRQVPMLHTAQKTVQVPQVQYTD